MSRTYKHLSQDEQEQLAHMYWEQKSLEEIVKALSRDKGTISEELKVLINSDFKFLDYRAGKVFKNGIEG